MRISGTLAILVLAVATLAAQRPAPTPDAATPEGKLLQRIASRGKNQMPPLATSLVDEPAVELLRAWVRGMSEKNQTK